MGSRDILIMSDALPPERPALWLAGMCVTVPLGPDLCAVFIKSFSHSCSLGYIPLAPVFKSMQCVEAWNVSWGTHGQVVDKQNRTQGP